MEVIGKIFTSAPWWALVMAHSASNFGTYLFLTQLPTYMREILKFDIKSVSFHTNFIHIQVPFFK
jgi:hypothetical protein